MQGKIQFSLEIKLCSNKKAVTVQIHSVGACLEYSSSFNYSLTLWGILKLFWEHIVLPVANILYLKVAKYVALIESRLMWILVWYAELFWH